MTSPAGPAAVAVLALATVLAAGAAVGAGAPRRRAVVGRVPAPTRLAPGGGPGPVGAALGARRVPVGLVATTAVATAALLAGRPELCLALVGAWPVVRRWSERRRRRRTEALVERAIPDLLDLFVVVAAAGHPVGRCLELVAARAPAPVRPACRAAVDRRAMGAPLADVLADLGARLGPGVADLAATLAAAATSGAPLRPPLSGLADAERDRRRRRAEEEARRLPVSLLFPLVCCILPAFALLAVVPLLAAALGSLQL